MERPPRLTRSSPATDLLSALEGRSRLRHRRALRPVLADVAAGSHSVLELRYQRDAERRHGLPPGTRRRLVGRELTDVSYAGLGLVVELDGRFHLDPYQHRRDLDRATPPGDLRT